MKNNNVSFKYTENIHFNFFNNSLLTSNNNFKNFFFFFRIFLILIKNAHKNTKLYDILLFQSNFLNYINYCNFYDFKKKKNNLIINLIFSKKNIKYNCIFLFYIFCINNLNINLDTYDIEKKFFLFRNLEEYNEYWNTSINKNNMISKVLKKKTYHKNNEMFYLPTLNDKNIIKKYNLYNNELKSDFNNVFRQEISLTSKNFNINNSLTRNFSTDFFENSHQKDEIKNIYYNLENNSSFNIYLLKKIDDNNLLFWFKLLKTKKYNNKFNSNYFYKFFFLNKNFYLKKNLKKKINIVNTNININNKKYFLKELFLKNSCNLNFNVLNYYYIKYNNYYNNNIIKHSILSDKNNDFKDWNFEFYDYTKVIDLKNQLICIYNIITDNNSNSNNLFTFTSDNIINNMNYFYQYQFDKWLLKIMFSELNSKRLFLAYFVDIFNDINIDIFFNNKKIYMTNIINPNFLTTNLYTNLIKIASKVKYYNVIYLISNIITTYFYKFYYTNYNVYLSKINNDAFSDTIVDNIQNLYNSINFDVIRGDFISEFIYICSFTFFTKDPKPLVNWIVKVIHKINYRKHWKFFFLLQLNICSIASIFLKETNLAGFYLTIKGKLGSVGSVRKKIVHIKMGQYGFSRYYLKGDIYYLNAFTLTGKIGLKMIINYY